MSCRAVQIDIFKSDSRLCDIRSGAFTDCCSLASLAIPFFARPLVSGRFSFSQSVPLSPHRVMAGHIIDDRDRRAFGRPTVEPRFDFRSNDDVS
jgi:hypothetical protein